MDANDNIAYLDTMDEVLTMTLEFLEEARLSNDDVRMGAYLRMASRSLRCALEIYRDRIEQNRSAMKQGKKIQWQDFTESK